MALCRTPTQRCLAASSNSPSKSRAAGIVEYSAVSGKTLASVHRLYQAGHPGTGATDVSDRDSQCGFLREAIAGQRLHPDIEGGQRLIVEFFVCQQVSPVDFETGVVTAAGTVSSSTKRETGYNPPQDQVAVPSGHTTG